MDLRFKDRSKYWTCVGLSAEDEARVQEFFEALYPEPSPTSRNPRFPTTGWTFWMRLTSAFDGTPVDAYCARLDSWEYGEYTFTQLDDLLREIAGPRRWEVMNGK